MAPTEVNGMTIVAPRSPAGALRVDVAAVERDLAPICSRPLRCRSTGRVPIAQPPGSETRASRTRASSGPSTRIEARILRTMS